VDPRWMITFGLSLFAASLWLTSYMTPEWGFAAFALPQMLRGFAIMLCIVPSVNLALSGFAMAELRYASGLFNLMRNLGGAVGIAIVNTWLQDYTRIDVARIGESLGEPGRHAPQIVAELAARFTQLSGDAAHALLLAQAELGQLVARNALTVSFNEVFRQMAWLFIAALMMVPFCRPAAAGSPAPPPDAH
jgi:MFS transporter, DHA2 family, multidrug resistance protein